MAFVPFDSHPRQVGGTCSLVHGDSQLDSQRISFSIIPHQTYRRSSYDGLECTGDLVSRNTAQRGFLRIRDEGQLFLCCFASVVEVDDARFDRQTSSYRIGGEQQILVADVRLSINLGHDASNDWRPGRCLDKLHARMVPVSNFLEVIPHP